MKLEIPHPDRGFKTATRNGLTLITPNYDKHQWTPEDRIYRSVILNEDGEVVSSGFPKFGNWGESGFEDNEEAILADPNVLYTTKVDGSLAIRSVINGEVVWRTRGTFDGGEFREHIERCAYRPKRIEHYNVLSDPTICPDASMLFEFVSPNFRVILPYGEPELILLGGVNHEDLSLWNWDQVESWGYDILEMWPVTTHGLPDDIDELISIVGQWKGKEGVVARTYDGRAMSKIKSASYLALHRLRFLLSTNALRELCENEHITSLDKFKDYIQTQGADWELLKDCEPIVNVYCDTCAEVRYLIYPALQYEVEKNKEKYPNRKDFAVEWANGLDNSVRSSVYLLLDGKEEQAQAKLLKNKMDEALAKLKDLDPKEEF